MFLVQSTLELILLLCQDQRILSRQPRCHHLTGGCIPVIIGLLGPPSNAFNQSVNDLMLSDSFVAYTDELLPNADTFDMSRVKYLEVAFWWCTKTYHTVVTSG